MNKSTSKRDAEVDLNTLLTQRLRSKHLFPNQKYRNKQQAA